MNLIQLYGISTISALCMITVVQADSIKQHHEKNKYAISITATPIPLNHKNPALNRVGKLLYLGGIKIASDTKRFGGISSFIISPDGHKILGVSDHGHWLTAEMVYDKNDHLVDITNAQMAPLKKIRGQRHRTAHDAEAITAVDGAGYVVSFESPHSLRYFQATDRHDYNSLFSANAQKVTFAPELPESYAALPQNLGVEALTTLLDGRMLAFSESTITEGTDTYAQGWLIGHGKIEALSYKISPSYKPTDMATMPNGDILVLERHFSLAKGMAARLTRLPAMTIKAGKTITGEVIADLAYPYNLDNMEALAVRQNEVGETIIYIMSDNNYNRLQRNLLMMFRIEEGIKKAAEQVNGFDRILVRRD